MSKIAFIYPIRGEKAGMGKDFYENSSLAAKPRPASQALGFGYEGAVL